MKLQTADPVLNFDFLKKGLGLVSLEYFALDFSKKYFWSSILLTDQVPITDCFYFLRSLAIWVL